MQALKQRPRARILCAFRSGIAFSTSDPTLVHIGIDRTARRVRRQREKEEDLSLHKGRYDRLDPYISTRNADRGDAKQFSRTGRVSPWLHGDVKRARGDEEPAFLGRKTLSFGRARWESHEEAITACLAEMEGTIYEEGIYMKLKLAPEDLEGHFARWKTHLEIQMKIKNSSDYEIARLSRLWKTSDEKIFRLHMKYAFYGRIVGANFSNADIEDQEALANLRWPTEWFPATRGFQREFHLHVGPTNSGKTYRALKRLEEAKTGLYAGPLRLLAHEVYLRLNARGQRCNLITGDERRASDEDPMAPMTSCTVEMVPLNAKLDVAVIDEIQMIGSDDRGWAWTQAVLGVMAKEVHCCGEERAVPIMQELAAMCGDPIHIHRYERLSPLQMSQRSLAGNLKLLQKGDCIVCFKILDIHGLRQIIEKTLKVKVAVIYGSLPPETRAQQAKLFNDPDSGYDILIASNAIGMGLNLSIKRLIFQTSTKFDGAGYGTLTVAETKQIAGRAGRYSTAEQDMKKSASNLDIAILGEEAHAAAPIARVPTKSVGYVTTLENFDFPIIKKLMTSQPEPLTSAGVQPPAYIIERFAKYFPPGTPFAYLLIRLNEISETSTRFFLCDLRQAIAIADVIESVEGLTTTDRLIFCAAPIEPRKAGEPAIARAYATMVAESRACSIVDVEELDFEILQEDYEASRSYLMKLEFLHKAVITWNWLSFRFAGVFVNRELAMHVKGLVEARIEETLARLSYDYDKMRATREKAIMKMLAKENQPEQEAGDGIPDSNNPERAAKGIEDRVAGWIDRLAERDAKGRDQPSTDRFVSVGEEKSSKTEPRGSAFEETVIDEQDIPVKGSPAASVAIFPRKEQTTIGDEAVPGAQATSVKGSPPAHVRSQRFKSHRFRDRQ